MHNDTRSTKYQICVLFGDWSSAINNIGFTHMWRHLLFGNNWDSVVVLKTNPFRLEGPKSRLGQEIFLSLETSRAALDRPSVLLNILYTGVFYSRGVNGSQRIIDQSRSSEVEVKNEWRYTCTPPVHLQGVHSDKYTFYMFILFKNWGQVSAFFRKINQWHMITCIAYSFPLSCNFLF
jgi:hypothetical protein